MVALEINKKQIVPVKNGKDIIVRFRCQVFKPALNRQLLRELFPLKIKVLDGMDRLRILCQSKDITFETLFNLTFITRLIPDFGVSPPTSNHSFFQK